MTFQCLPFEQLSVNQLYDVMALRQEVFVVEQNCVYLDADGKDQASWHLLGRDENGKLLAYARLLPKGTVYAEYPAIGRIASAPSVRGSGIGRELVSRSIEECYRIFGRQSIKIGAQLYLLKFYQSFGFEAIGEEYLEDGIPHITMIKKVQTL